MHENSTQKNTIDTQSKKGMIGAFIVLFKTHPVLVSILWLGFFIVMLGISFILGLVPKLETDTSRVSASTTTTQFINTSVTDTAREDSTPVRIVIERIGIDTTIVNPESRDIEDLDAALLEGVVRYPGSGDLKDVSNMFLFGHSTGFRVVQNEAFKAFNGLKNAQEGDLIRVQSKTNEYVYRVVAVSLVNADEALVSLSGDEKKLTLTTCNSFGQKQERYVVEADFVGSYALKIQ